MYVCVAVDSHSDTKALLASAFISLSLPAITANVSLTAVSDSQEREREVNTNKLLVTITDD